MCNGLIYKAKRNKYIGSDGCINLHLKLYLMKRKSCGVCPMCQHILTTLDNYLQEATIEGIEYIHEGHLYKLEACNAELSFKLIHLGKHQRLIQESLDF